MDVFFFFVMMLIIGGLVVANNTGARDALREALGPEIADQLGIKERPRTPLPLPSAPVGFALIREHDPAFDLTRFYETVAEMFVAVRRAEAGGDVSKVRHLVRGEAWEYLQRREPDGLDGDVKVSGVTATTVRREGDRDIVRARIVARTASGTPIQRYWKLERGTRALTLAQPSIWKCPNCGGPIDGDDRSRCAYCGVRLDDPNLDWVVTEIQQV